MKMAAAVSKERRIRPSLSYRQSRCLLASSQVQPCSTTHRTFPMPRAVDLADLTDVLLNAVALAEPAVVGADHLGQAQQIRKELGVMHIGERRGNCRRQAIGRDDHMIHGAGLTVVSRVRAGQLTAPLGPHRATVHHSVTCGGVGAAARHADEDGMDITPCYATRPGGAGLPSHCWPWSVIRPITVPLPKILRGKFPAHGLLDDVGDSSCCRPPHPTADSGCRRLRMVDLEALPSDHCQPIPQAYAATARLGPMDSSGETFCRELTVLVLLQILAGGDSAPRLSNFSRQSRQGWRRRQPGPTCRWREWQRPALCAPWRGLVAGDRPACGVETFESEPRPHQPFDPPPILFNDIIQVSYLAQVGEAPQLAGLLHRLGLTRVGSVLVHGEGQGAPRRMRLQRRALSARRGRAAYQSAARTSGRVASAAMPVAIITRLWQGFAPEPHRLSSCDSAPRSLCDRSGAAPHRGPASSLRRKGAFWIL